MNEDQRTAVTLSLMDALHQQGSWCGETHIQKALYFLQELAHVAMPEAEDAWRIVDGMLAECQELAA